MGCFADQMQTKKQSPEPDNILLCTLTSAVRIVWRTLRLWEVRLTQKWDQLRLRDEGWKGQ